MEPRHLRAGTAWTWQRTLSQYPAPAWTLRYYLKNATHSITIEAQPDGRAHRVEITAEQTRDHAPGGYAFVAQVDDGTGIVHEVASGWITVKPRVDTASPLEMRSRAARIVEDLEAALEAYSAAAGQDASLVQSYQIGDRAQTFRSTAEIIEQLEYWRGRLAQERAADAMREGLGNPRNVYVRFGKP